MDTVDRLTPLAGQQLNIKEEQVKGKALMLFREGRLTESQAVKMFSEYPIFTPAAPEWFNYTVLGVTFVFAFYLMLTQTSVGSRTPILFRIFLVVSLFMSSSTIEKEAPGNLTTYFLFLAACFIMHNTLDKLAQIVVPFRAYQLIKIDFFGQVQ